MKIPQADEAPGTVDGDDWMLAIDTSTSIAGIGLARGDILLSRMWDAGRAQTTDVLPAIDALVSEAGITPDDIGSIAVAIGPGTFTGLRVGMSLAKGMLASKHRLLYGVPTLDVTAAGIDAGLTSFIVTLPAGRGRIVSQAWRDGAGGDYRNQPFPVFVDSILSSESFPIFGELEPDEVEALIRLGRRAECRDRCPRDLIHLARKRQRHGADDDPVKLEPFYLHGAPVLTGAVRDKPDRQGT